MENARHNSIQLNSHCAKAARTKQPASQPLWLFNGDERSSSEKIDVILVIVAQFIWFSFNYNQVLSNRYILSNQLCDLLDCV